MLSMVRNPAQVLRYESVCRQQQSNVTTLNDSRVTTGNKVLSTAKTLQQSIAHTELLTQLSNCDVHSFMLHL
jgi:hypothetical protein